MEALAITILSIFAAIGLISTQSYLFRLIKSKTNDIGIKIILYLPRYSSSKLEGIVRQIFSEEIPEKLMSDRKVYLMVAPGDEETMNLLEKLKDMYPLEVLPDQVSYCMISKERNM